MGNIIMFEEDKEITASDISLAEAKDIVILVAEDEEKIREPMVSTLEIIFKKVYKAADGIEAKTILEANNDVNVVITDINMPNMCGNDLIKYLISRQDKFLPVVVATAHQELSCEYNGIECIMIEPKPINMRKLICKIIELYKKRQESDVCDISKDVRDVAFQKVHSAANTAKDLLKIMRSEYIGEVE